jgi:hypothetical protein
MASSVSSGLIGATAATQVATGRQLLNGLIVISDNVNPATVMVYDNGSGAASGTVLAKLTATVNTGANSLAIVDPIRAENGLVVAVTGTGTPQAIILYGA